jgi:putative oxidoreductase
MTFLTDYQTTDRAATAKRDVVLLLARILLGWIFLRSGFGKVTDVGAFTASLARRGLPMPEVLGPLGAAVEFFGGIALIIGFKIRYSALLMVAFIVIATLIGHRFWEYADAAARNTQLGQFNKNLALIGGMLALWVAGAGRLSVDRIWRRK